MKRKPLDTRLNWRDPNMPVLRDYKMANGTKKEVVDPDYEHRYRDHLMQSRDEPTWYSDPTYNLRKNK